jgi:hypothetical protein
MTNKLVSDNKERINLQHARVAMFGQLMSVGSECPQLALTRPGQPETGLVTGVLQPSKMYHARERYRKPIR